MGKRVARPGEALDYELGLVGDATGGAERGGPEHDGKEGGVVAQGPANSPHRPASRCRRPVSAEHQRRLGLDPHANTTFELDHAVPGEHLSGARERTIQRCDG